MHSTKRLTAAGFATALFLTAGAAPAARAADRDDPDVAAFYLRGTCLCNTVPVAQEALGLADGYLDGAGPITGVGYPAGLLFALDSAFGASGVNSQLAAVPDGIKITLAGVSQGAIVLDYVKQSLALQVTPARPRTDLSFVTFGDPMNHTGGVVAKNPLLWLSVPPGPLPTPYDTTEIVREYDGLSDWPDRPTALSVMNALMGVAYVHPFYGPEADPRKPGTVKTVKVNAVGGTTTHYVVPTTGLPITQPLRDVGINTTLVDKWLRPRVDSSYSVRPPAPEDSAPAGKSSTDDAVPDAQVTHAASAVPKPPRRVAKSGVDRIRSMLGIPTPTQGKSRGSRAVPDTGSAGTPPPRTRSTKTALPSRGHRSAEDSASAPKTAPPTGA
ncbi:PE-PPE domain-containing protein [Mycobacterium sp. BMJ-28]